MVVCHPGLQVRLKQICFSVRPWSEHYVADPDGEWGHPVACIGVLSGHILLMPLLLDSCCWGWRWSWLKEWCNHSSMWCGHGGLGDGEVCLWILVEARGSALLTCWCPGNWLWCCCSLLLQPLLWGHELLDKVSPLGHWASSFLLLSTEGELAQDKQQASMHHLP